MDNEYNSWFGKVGLEYGFKDLGIVSFEEIKYYVDNFINRSFGCVGFLYGVDLEKVGVYKDNLLNWKLGCVGLFDWVKV